MYRLLLDTNILLDSLLSNRPEHIEALRLLKWCNGSGDYGFATSTSFNDIYYILRKTYDEPLARKAVNKLMEYVAIAPVAAEECHLSLNSNEPDFEDGLIRACAELNDADFIITRDKKAFQGTKIKSLTASDFFEQIDHDNKELLAQLFPHNT